MTRQNVADFTKIGSPQTVVFNKPMTCTDEVFSKASLYFSVCIKLQRRSVSFVHQLEVLFGKCSYQLGLPALFCVLKEFRGVENV